MLLGLGILLRGETVAVLGRRLITASHGASHYRRPFVASLRCGLTPACWARRALEVPKFPKVPKVPVRRRFATALEVEQ